MLAEERQRKRQALLEATEKDLEKLLEPVIRRTKTPLSAAEIGRKVGRIIDRFQVAKHFDIAIADRQFAVTSGESKRSNAKPNWMESMGFAPANLNRAGPPKIRYAVIKIWLG